MAGPTREWVTFDDPEGRGPALADRRHVPAVVVDCIFGCGCQGVLTGPAPELVQGCCSYGAHFSDRKDRDHVVKSRQAPHRRRVAVRRRRPQEGHLRQGGQGRGRQDRVAHPPRRRRVHLPEPPRVRRRASGCALHIHADAHRPAPQRRQARGVLAAAAAARSTRSRRTGRVISTLTEFGRDGWGEGGDDFRWWCTEAPEAFVGDASPSTASLERGAAQDARRQALHARSSTYLDEPASKAQPAPVVHPAEATRVAAEPSRRTTGASSDQRHPAVEDEHLAGHATTDASDARNSAAPAMSSGTPMRRSGWRAATPASSGSQSARANSVFTRPGAIAFTRTVGRELQRELPRHVEQRRLRHVVDADERRGREAADRRDVEDRPAVLAHPRAPRVLREQQRALDVHLEHLADRARLGLDHRPERRVRRRVVDEDVEPAELGDAPGDRGLDDLGVAGGSGDGEDRAAERAPSAARSPRARRACGRARTRRRRRRRRPRRSPGRSPGSPPVTSATRPSRRSAVGVDHAAPDHR